VHQFLVENSIYVVLLVVLIIWLGITAFLFIVEKKLTKLEQDLEEKGIKNE
jgi:CcmD family protein